MYWDFGFAVKVIRELLEASEEHYVELMTGMLVKMKGQLTELERNIGRMERLLFDKQK